MITEVLINLIYSIVSALLSLFPEFTGLPSGMGSAIDYIASFTYQIGDILPTATMWTIIKLSITLELAILSFNFLAWVFHWKQAKG